MNCRSFNIGEVAADLNEAVATRLLLHPELCRRVWSLVARCESLLVDGSELDPCWWVFQSWIPAGGWFRAGSLLVDVSELDPCCWTFWSCVLLLSFQAPPWECRRRGEDPAAGAQWHPGSGGSCPAFLLISF